MIRFSGVPPYNHCLICDDYDSKQNACEMPDAMISKEKGFSFPLCQGYQQIKSVFVKKILRQAKSAEGIIANIRKEEG